MISFVPVYHRVRFENLTIVSFFTMIVANNQFLTIFMQKFFLQETGLTIVDLFLILCHFIEKKDPKLRNKHSKIIFFQNEFFEFSLGRWSVVNPLTGLIRGFFSSIKSNFFLFMTYIYCICRLTFVTEIIFQHSFVKTKFGNIFKTFYCSLSIESYKCFFHFIQSSFCACDQFIYFYQCNFI